MTPSGREHSDTIHRDIGCPKCNYNLRGLSGETVACPECGARWQTSEIQIERWMRRKDRLPGLLEIRAMPAVAIFGVYILAITFALIWEEYFSPWAPAGGSGLMARGRVTRDVIIVGFSAVLTFGGLLLLAGSVATFRISRRQIGTRCARRVALLVVIEYIAVIAGLIASFQVAMLGITILDDVYWPRWTSIPVLDVRLEDQLVTRSIVAALVLLIAFFVLRRTGRGLRTTLIAGLTAAGAHRAHMQS